jgi:membrane-bound ClpP family serine protease
MSAAIAGHESVCRLLIDKGANVNTKMEDTDWTPLMFAAHNGCVLPICLKWATFVLCQAAAWQLLVCIACLLMVCVSACVCVACLLVHVPVFGTLGVLAMLVGMLALRRSYLSVVQVLLHNKADTNAVNALGQLALDIAVCAGHVEVDQYLSKHSDTSMSSIRAIVRQDIFEVGG